MKFTVEVTRFSPHYPKDKDKDKDKEKEPNWWDVAFTITHEDGRVFFTPTTVFPSQTNGSQDEGIVVAAAVRDTLPGQIALMYADKPKSKPDFFDTMKFENEQDV